MHESQPPDRDVPQWSYHRDVDGFHIKFIAKHERCRLHENRETLREHAAGGYSCEVCKQFVFLAEHERDREKAFELWAAST